MKIEKILDNSYLVFLAINESLKEIFSCQPIPITAFR